MPTTYTWPTLIGGIIMGLGFVLGGFCLGTSVCVAAIGKLDALAFIGGIIIEIFFYSFTYEPLWEVLRGTGKLGKVKIGELIGVGEGLAVLIFAVVVLLSFWLVDKIKKVYNIKDVEY